MRRELVVIAKPEAGLRSSSEKLYSTNGVDISTLTELLDAKQATLQPLFGSSEYRLQQEAAFLKANVATEVTDLSKYYRIQAPEDQLDELAARLLELDSVEAAYVKPAPELPHRMHGVVATTDSAYAITPNFTQFQNYLSAAPNGIDVDYATRFLGSGGAGINIIDIERDWCLTHEDLRQNQGGIVGGYPTGQASDRNHGTAVLGVISGDRNGYGITGICPDANIRCVSWRYLGVAGAIYRAATILNPGDIILIEVHYPGPKSNFEQREDQLGYLPVEWWPDEFAAIQYATSRSIIVVEAAGNGGENLDSKDYDQRPVGFPLNWKNPFNRNNCDSGAIVVGAGAPPPGQVGDWSPNNQWQGRGPDRCRLYFSNYGSIVDAQGWGCFVTTCGYGDLQNSGEEYSYTTQFAGTSSASPMVVGALASMQGILRAHGKRLLTPTQARELLLTTGSPQQDGPNGPASEQRIGNRPNLHEMINRKMEPAVANSSLESFALYHYFDKRWRTHFYTTTAPAEISELNPDLQYQDILCYLHLKQQPGTVPLHRYRSIRKPQRFYTIYPLNDPEWIYERIEGFVYREPHPGTAPLYCYQNNRQFNLLYTTEEMLDPYYGGYTLYGIQGYALSPSEYSAALDGNGAMTLSSSDTDAISTAPITGVPIDSISHSYFSHSNLNRSGFPQMSNGIVNASILLPRY